jgi:hypothetical protein
MAAENELPVAKDASGLDEAGLLEGLTDSSVPGALTGFDARMVKRAGYWFPVRWRARTRARIGLGTAQRARARR